MIGLDPATVFVIGCPSGGLVYTIRTPYVACWAGTGPLRVAQFKTREQADAAVMLALLNETTRHIAVHFEVVGVESADPSVLAELAVAWVNKPLPATSGLDVIPGAVFAERRRVLQQLHQRHHDN